LNKTTLLTYVDKYFSQQTLDQEIEQKARALDTLYLVLTLHYPGFFIPKPTKKTLKTLNNAAALTSEKRDLLTAYIRRLADYQYLIQHSAFK